MSIISQNDTNEVAIFDFVQRFFHKVDILLKKCNGTKEKGVPVISLLRYKLSSVITGRSMYIQQRTGSFKEEIIRIYKKRWQIEVFFKTSKSILNLIGECHSLSYDALTAHVAIVFTRYVLLALEQRKSEYQRTLGELFLFLVDEIANITFARSLCTLMNALMASPQEILKLSKEQLAEFTADYISRLPQHLQNALNSRETMA